MDYYALDKFCTSLGRRLVLVTTIGLMLTFASFLAFTSTSHASGAKGFCAHAWLNKYGQTGDFCTDPEYHYNFEVVVQSEEHSACGSTTTTWDKSGVNVSWVCTSGPYGINSRRVDWDVYTRGIIRNNTTSDTNHGTGSVGYCSTKGCAQG